MDTKIGFIGQGWIGKNYANHFEERGFNIVRYGLEPEFISNKDLIKSCDITYIAVPTPTVDGTVVLSNIRSAISLIGKGKIAVIKSTIPPGTTVKFSEEFPDVIVLHSPEFLREAFARHDVDNPIRNIIGIPKDDTLHSDAAQKVMSICPRTKFEIIVLSHKAEFIKYVHNTFGYAMVLFSNILYDLADAHNVDWDIIKLSIESNPWIPGKYITPVHQGGRGAGGDCFIKDFASFVESYKTNIPNDKLGIILLEAMENKNNELLRSTGKSIELLNQVYKN